MKTYLSLLVLAVFFLGACSAQKETSVVYDDVYYSSKPDNKKAATREQRTDSYTASEVYTSSEYIETRDAVSDDYYYEDERKYTEANYTGSEFDYDDYYDYSYSSRIRRFHNPNPGFSYYDTYYTNVYYYDYNPWAYGTSIYMGYNFWYPSYRPLVSVYFGWGWPYYSYGWGWPYYSYGWGWPYYYNSWGWPYYYGWNRPYYGCYYGHYYPYDYYYNSYDYNSHYYGPRGSRGFNSNGAGSSYSRDARTFGEKYEDGLAVGPGTRVSQAESSLSQGSGRKSAESVSTGRTEQGSGRTIAPESPAARSRYTQDQPAGRTEAPVTGVARQPSTLVKEGGRTPAERFTRAEPAPSAGRQEEPGQPQARESNTPVSPAARQAQERYQPGQTRTPASAPLETGPATRQGQERYQPSQSRESGYTGVRPEQRYSKPRTYEAPEHRSTPPAERYRQSTPNTGSTINSQRTPSSPQTESRTISSPSNTRTYSAPTRTQSRSYSPPTQSRTRSTSTPGSSYSAPSRSNTSSGRSSGSISSPSRSSGTISSPGRSSGSSSGRSSSPSGSSSGSRGGRR